MDKRAWLNRKGAEAEKAVKRNDAKTLFCVVRATLLFPSNTRM